MLLRAHGGGGTEHLVRLYQNHRGTWTLQRVLTHPCTPQDHSAIEALPAGVLAESWCPPLLPGQRSDVPALPIEFHLPQSGEEGPSEAASLFHPHLGLATVASRFNDDPPDAEPRSTHARGESVELPLSAVRSRAKKLDRWGGRVWFRLDGQLYAICEGEWHLAVSGG